MKVLHYVYKPEYRDGEVFEQLAVAHYDNAWGWGRFFGILRDPQGARSIFIRNVGKTSFDTKYLIKMDDEFETRHGANWRFHSANCENHHGAWYRYFLHQ